LEDDATPGSNGTVMAVPQPDSDLIEVIDNVE
jgi:hypothetical protein